ncbi:MAG TPA: ATP-binding protein [Candidatus Cybelea sp.]|nr:ATP-binding protein [Candidatus Cybelea sp.]
MKTARGKRASRPTPSRRSGRSRFGAAQGHELAKLRARLAEAQETLRAIRAGEVDAVVVAAKKGAQVFTLHGAEHAYRVLIESMNEGALTLTADKVILYANQCFARMVKCPLEQVVGSSLRRFLCADDRATLRLRLKRADPSGSKFQVLLHAADGSRMPAHISLRPLARNGFKSAIFGMVVTDMTESCRTEQLLRALTQRVVQVQEAERSRVALELHDNITQLLCAILVRCQTLARQLSPRGGPMQAEAIKLRELLGQAAEEVVRIARNLRPSVLDDLGLVAVLRDTSTEFAKRTHVTLKLTCVKLIARLPAEAELALYRILQEALNNVEKHARARHVTVCLSQRGDFVQLAIKDDGTGFNQDSRPAKGNGEHGLGLLGMRERAAYVGGALQVKSVRRGGTHIEVRIPLPPPVKMKNSRAKGLGGSKGIGRHLTRIMAVF